MEWNDSYTAPRKTTPLDNAVVALVCGDAAAFQQAVAGVADLDAENSILLRTAAEENRYVEARDLILRGANVLPALEYLSAQLAPITRYGRMNNYGKEGHEAEYKKLSRQKHRLESWRRTIIEEMPIVTSRQQQKLEERQEDILRQLEELRGMVAEILGNRSMDKPVLPPAGKKLTP